MALPLQKVQQHVASTCDAPPDDDDIDTVISAYFQNLHAALQFAEKGIRDEVLRQRNLDELKLTSIRRDIHSRAETLRELLRVANDVIVGAAGETHKVNVREVNKQLDDATNMPCFFKVKKSLMNKKIE